MKLDLSKYLDAAQSSKWALRKLNFILGMGIPFNKPHGIKITKVEPNTVVTTIPLKRKNKNHINGIHACGLATTAEFCSGLVLLRMLNPKDYRLIMQKIEVEYHYQAKHTCHARFEMNAEVFKTEILQPLENDGVAFYTCEIPVHDVKGNLVCTAYTRWQIKSWKDVKTRK